MEWKELALRTGAKSSIDTPLYGGAQKVGASISLGKKLRNLIDFSIGGVEYHGLNWSVFETRSGSIIVTGLDKISELGIYYEISSDGGDSGKNIKGASESGKPASAIVEIGLVHNGTAIRDAAGTTAGVGARIPLGKYAIGISREKDVDAGLITDTASLGLGKGDIRVFGSDALVEEITRKVEREKLFPFIYVNNADFLKDIPSDRASQGARESVHQFFILNAVEGSRGVFDEVASLFKRFNTAIAFERDGRAVFYLRTRDGAEYYYDPETGEYASVQTGIRNLGISVSSTEMKAVFRATTAASGHKLNIVTPSKRSDDGFGADIAVDSPPADQGAKTDTNDFGETAATYSETSDEPVASARQESVVDTGTEVEVIEQGPDAPLEPVHRKPIIIPRQTFNLFSDLTTMTTAALEREQRESRLAYDDLTDGEAYRVLTDGAGQGATRFEHRNRPDLDVAQTGDDVTLHGGNRFVPRASSDPRDEVSERAIPEPRVKPDAGRMLPDRSIPVPTVKPDLHSMRPDVAIPILRTKRDLTAGH